MIGWYYKNGSRLLQIRLSNREISELGFNGLSIGGFMIYPEKVGIYPLRLIVDDKIQGSIDMQREGSGINVYVKPSIREKLIRSGQVNIELDKMFGSVNIRKLEDNESPLVLNALRGFI